MKTGITEIIGRTIKGVLVKEGDGSNVMLIFSDGTYYEFYSDSLINGCAGVDFGGMKEAMKVAEHRQVVMKLELPPVRPLNLSGRL